MPWPAAPSPLPLPQGAKATAFRYRPATPAIASVLHAFSPRGSKVPEGRMRRAIRDEPRTIARSLSVTTKPPES